MADAPVMDRMFQRIMRGLVDTGTAPQYAELARALGLGVEEGPSFPPLNNLPMQYRITVRGAQYWFAQCGFEATSDHLALSRRDGARRRPVPRLRRSGERRDAGRPGSGGSIRREERRAYLELIGKTSPFWLGTPDNA
jgi:hypothetical protein